MAEPADAPPASRAPERVLDIAREVRARERVLRCSLGAATAWAVTLAPLAVSGRSSLVVRALSMLAVVPAVVGAQLLQRDARRARQLGITGFLAVAAVTWTVGSVQGALVGIDGFRAILGALAWGVFALAWSHPWSVDDQRLVAAPEGETSGLEPRRRPPWSAVAVAALGVGGAFLCLGLAWRIPTGSRAVLAQAVATGAAVALVTSGSSVAVAAGRERRRDRRAKIPINRRVLNGLLLMVAMVALAIALSYSR